MVGNLSSIISASYNDATTSDGMVQKFSPDFGPEVFEILIPENYKGKQLPLWQFTLKPNYDF